MTDAPLMPPSPPPPPPNPNVRPENVPHPLPFVQYRKFTDEDVKPFLDGFQWVPNFEPLPLEKALPYIISGYGHTYHRSRFKMDGRQYGQPDAIYFLEVGQGGGMKGNGVVIYSTLAYGHTSVDQFHGGTFAICKHESVEGPGANHQRGWHPAFCKHCGIDLSVDSGD